MRGWPPRSRYPKADLKEFTKWLWGVAGAQPSSRWIGLYQRACVCRMFPAYRLGELRETEAAEILQAMELMNVADKALSKG